MSPETLLSAYHKSYDKVKRYAASGDGYKKACRQVVFFEFKILDAIEYYQDNKKKNDLLEADLIKKLEGK